MYLLKYFSILYVFFLGCSKKSFSCEDWSHHGLASTCVPLEKRCDNIPDCPNGKDEEKCSVLANSVSNDEVMTKFIQNFMENILHL